MPTVGGCSWLVSVPGSQTRAVRPCGAPARSRTLMPRRAASRETANRPMCRETDTSTPGGWSSRQFISARRLVETPTPSSRISISTPPPGASAAATWTWVFRGENRVAFSSSSASRCTTSAAACPETMIPG